MRSRGRADAIVVLVLALIIASTFGAITDEQQQFFHNDDHRLTQQKSRIRRRGEEGELHFSENDQQQEARRGQATGQGNGRHPGLLLQMCEEGCEKDADCADGLNCRHHTAKKAFAGCPDSKGLKQFCYDPNYKAGGTQNGAVEQSAEQPTSSYTQSQYGTPAVLSGNAWVPRNPSEYPLQKCQGHCTQNGDCYQGLQCYQRKTNEFFVPGCMGKADQYGTNYCYDPTDLTIYTPPPTFAPVIKPPTYAPVSVKPTSAPYTLAPYTVAPSGAPVTGAPIAPTFAPATGTPVTSAPTLAPVSAAPQYKPTPQPTWGASNERIPLSEPGNDQVPFDVFPLQRCQGDCDGDSECADGLICYFRDGTTPVPGCSGDGYPNTDYCIDRNDDPAKPPVMGAFRIKEYWEPGYTWQEITWEADWCFQCMNATCYQTTIPDTPECRESRCDIGDIFVLRPCGINNVWFELVVNFNGTVRSVSEIEASYQNLLQTKYPKFVSSYNRQVASAYFEFTRAQYAFYNYEEPPNRTFFEMPKNLGAGPDEAFHRLLASYYDDEIKNFINGNARDQKVFLRLANTNLCLALVTRMHVQVQPCDYKSRLQQWRPGNGNFYGKNFEIRPAASTEGCLTQQHHPREFEQIFNQSCELPRQYHTTLFVKY